MKIRELFLYIFNFSGDTGENTSLWLSTVCLIPARRSTNSVKGESNETPQQELRDNRGSAAFQYWEHVNGKET